MRPASMRSRWLMHRSSVVLPEPDGPMITTVSPWRTSSDTSRSTTSGPNDLERPPSAGSAHRRRPSSRPPRRADFDAAARAEEPAPDAGAADLAAARGEAALDPALDEAPDRRQRQVVDGRGEEDLERPERRGVELLG